MHELTLCRNILAIIDQHTEECKGMSVKKVVLEVGTLTCVDHLALEFSFDVVMKGSQAEKASLEIVSVEGQGLCDVCGQTTTMSRYDDPCQFCGQFLLRVIQGEELKVKYLEME